MSLIDQLGQDPIKALEKWLNEAVALKLGEPTAMTLATANAEGVPHARVVLCKDISSEGITFFTNYQSDKGQDLEVNPRASAVFFWQPLGRQVRFEGRVTKVQRSVSEAYFATRPRESQIGAWASQQSKPVASLAAFMDDVKQVAERYSNQQVPCPPHWGGYLLMPEYAEFWLAAEGRLHDRVGYKKTGAIWQLGQRYP